MQKLTIEKACNLAEKAVKAFSKRGRGLLLFVGAEREGDLRKFAIELAKRLGEKEALPIYVIQGHIRGEHAWPFSRIKKGARLRLMPDGTAVTETGGLIFPQDFPIVLLVEYFDHLGYNDQRAYCHLVDGEGGDYALHTGSVLIGGLISTTPGRLEPGSVNRGMRFDLVTE